MLTIANLSEAVKSEDIGAFPVNEESLSFLNKLIAAERTRCARICQEIAIKHQKDEGTYAAGKKAGALECDEAIRVPSFED